MSLLPIVAGCSLSAMKEVSFAWSGFNNAMLSNLGMVLRNIYSKKSLNDYKVPPGRVRAAAAGRVGAAAAGREGGRQAGAHLLHHPTCSATCVCAWRLRTHTRTRAHTHTHL